MKWKILGWTFTIFLLLFSCKTIEYVTIEPEPPILPETIETLVLEAYSFTTLYSDKYMEALGDLSEEYMSLLEKAETIFTINAYNAFAQEIKRKMWEIKIKQITFVITEIEYLELYKKYEDALNSINDKIKKLKNPYPDE